MKRYLLSLALVTMASNGLSAQTVLKFDDVPGATTNGGGVALTNQYAGAGITFVGSAVAFCLNRTTLTCSNTSWGSGADAVAAAARGTAGAAMFWSSGSPIMNSSVGFTTGFSFYYSNPFAVASAFEVWSGLNATGSLLASFALGGTLNGSSITGCFSANYCPFVAGGVAFAGTGQSVRFTGGSDRIVYDDITFGSVIPGVVTPEPSTYLLMAAGLAALLPLARRRRRKV